MHGNLRTSGRGASDDYRSEHQSQAATPLAVLPPPHVVLLSREQRQVISVVRGCVRSVQTRRDGYAANVREDVTVVKLLSLGHILGPDENAQRGPSGENRSE